MLRQEVSLIAPHTVAECVELLKPHIETSFMFFGKQPYAGKLTESKLSMRKRIFYQNSFQSVLEAKMLAYPEQNQTQIVGHIGLARSVIYFGMFYLTLVLLGVSFLSIPAVIDCFSSQSKAVNGNLWVGILVPPGMLLFAFLLVSFGRWLARREEAEIMDFLKQTIHATPNIIV